MKIEIKNRYTREAMISGEYESIKECIAALRHSDLWNADLSKADLRHSDLSKADLRHSDLSKADLRNSALWHAALRHADLRHADLRHSDLRNADLWNADLRHADLRRIKNYSESHQIFQHLVKGQSIKVFTESEWAMIGKIILHMPCWDTIKNKFGRSFLRVLEILKDAGWPEYYDKYVEILGEQADE